MGVDVRDRVCDAALVCLARWGLTKTTLEDVAREAGCGRATIYRTFRGGKSEVMGATLARELGRLRAEVGAAIEAAGPGDGPDDLEAVVVAGVVAAARFLRGHDALHYLLRHEPDVVLPWVSFDRVGIVYDAVAAFAAPHLARFVPDPEAAARAAERLTRVVLSYSVNPAEGVDLADPASARRLLSTYVIPGLVLAARPPSLEEQCPATPT
jgi:AcrR family transcriptional regulator